jgi:PAS domain S-box-containing protein
MNNRQFTDKENARRVFQAFNKIYRTGEPVKGIDEEIIRKDGTKAFREISASLIRDSEGKPVGFRGISRDITERKKAEGALRESEERYRSLFENMLDGYAYCKMLFEHDRPRDFIYLGVNPSFETLTGMKNVVGRKVSEVIPGIQESNPELFEIYGRVALTGKPERFETYLPSLGICFAISVFSPAREYFVAVFDNITERKRAVEALRESEVRYRLLAENASDIIWTVNMNMQVTYISPSVSRLCGYTVEEAKSRTMEEAFTPASLETARRAFAEEMALENARQGDPNRSRILELELTCKDGVVVRVEANFSFLRDAMGKPVGILSIARDITERKRAEEEREKLIHELRDALVNVKTLRGLLPICSHCKKIRDDKGYWNQIESYIRDHSGAEFSHGMCPECLKKLYPDLVD